uniref:Mixed lineage kinase domain like pseudokinase n=1 Tax=Leptobrachium leishanense TaxID=445787 RepID=A0A8C5R845_9ANUR
MEVLTGIFTAAKGIYQLCEQAKSNKRQCTLLKNRIELLMVPIELLHSHPDKSREMEKTLKELNVILELAEDWVQKYNNKAWWIKFIRLGHFKDEFNHINSRISNVAESCQMLLKVDDRVRFMKYFAENRLQAQNQKAINQDIEEAIQSLRGEMHSMADRVDSLQSQMEDQKSMLLLQGISSKWEIKVIPSTDLKREHLVIDTRHHSLYRGEYHKDQVAIKVLKGDLNRDTEYVRREFNSDSSTMKRFECVNILRLFGICMDNSNSEPCYSLVMEFCEKGILRDLLNTERRLTWEQRVHMARDAARALYKLHHTEMKTILHGSLSSSKFLVDETYCLKLFDFQFSKTESSMRRNPSEKQESVGWVYLAPETLQDINAYSKRSEVYSLGVVLYEIASGRVPLEGLRDQKNHLNELHHMLRTEVDKELPVGCPEILRTIITQSLESDPCERPTAGVIADQLIAYLNQKEPTESPMETSI